MSENTEGQVEPSEQHIEASPVEQEALAQGWVPKDQFDGDESRWVDAPEFVRRGELFKKIDSQNRQIKEVTRTLAAFKDHYTKVEETAFNRALSTLKTQKLEAQKEGEFERAALIEDEIERVEEQKATLKESIPEVQEEVQVHPDVAAWIDRNSWYKTNARMKVVADAIGQELAGRGVQGPALLKAIDLEIRKEFPSKFTNPNRDKPSATEGAGSRVGKGNDSFKLTSEQEQIMNRFVRDKVLTKEQYIADLKSQMGVK